MLILGLIIGMCCFTAVTAEKEYYTWIDDNGINNYAERNPQGVSATFVSRNQSFSQKASNNTRQNGRPHPTPPNARPRSQTYPFHRPDDKNKTANHKRYKRPCFERFSHPINRVDAWLHPPSQIDNDLVD